MAAASGASSALEPTPEKRNFCHLVNLLISGGTRILREVLDSIHPPSTLPGVLSQPAVKSKLKAELPKPQSSRLYPKSSSGCYGKSADFDITSLFHLLRRICSFPRPQSGWNVLPPSTHQTVSDDLARVKYYRNNIYAHVRDMEIKDDDFKRLWAEISGALVRLARSISEAKRTEWQQAIAELQCNLSTEEAVEQLIAWYKNDHKLKNPLEGMHLAIKQVG